MASEILISIGSTTISMLKEPANRSIILSKASAKVDHDIVEGNLRGGAKFKFKQIKMQFTRGQFVQGGTQFNRKRFNLHDFVKQVETERERGAL